MVSVRENSKGLGKKPKKCERWTGGDQEGVAPLNISEF